MKVVRSSNEFRQGHCHGCPTKLVGRRASFRSYCVCRILNLVFSLADAPDSRSGPRKRVWVRVADSALKTFVSSQPAELPALVVDSYQRFGEIRAASTAGFLERSGGYRILLRYHKKAEQTLIVGRASEDEGRSESDRVGGS